MNIETILRNAQGGAIYQNIAQAFGLELDQAQKASEALMTELSARIERNTISRGGLADVVALLGEGTAGRAYVDPDHLAAPEIATVGNHVLDVLIGDKHASRGMAQRAARQTGVDTDVLKKLLPVVASMMVGALQRETQATFSSSLRNVPGLGGDDFNAGTNALLPLPGEAPNGGASTGSWGEQLPRTSGSSGGGVGGTGGGGVLLPLPGDSIPGTGRRNRYDDLSDVLRRGKTPVPQGGSLEAMIRSILGNLLGYGNRGIVGSILRVLLLRWGTQILRRILGGMIPGR
jgi:hypothetical protein